MTDINTATTNTATSFAQDSLDALKANAPMAAAAAGGAGLIGAVWGAMHWRGMRKAKAEHTRLRAMAAAAKKLQEATTTAKVKRNLLSLLKDQSAVAAQLAAWDKIEQLLADKANRGAMTADDEKLIDDSGILTPVEV